MDHHRWTTVSDSPHDHEREALAWLRSRLPDRDPYRVWANFEFVSRNGQLYEVDALAVTDSGVYLIEVKSYPGEIGGDGGDWQWITPEGRFVQFDNPRILANRKAKALRDLLARSRAFAGRGRDLPYITEVVFLSDPRLKVTLSPPGRFQVYGRDPDPGDELPPERARIGGLVEAITSIGPGPDGRAKRRVDRPLGKRIADAVAQIGIRERSDRRQVGDYRLVDLLADVEADADTGIAYQDFLGRHARLELQRRIRIYPLEHNADAERREAAARAAKREFELLRPLDHPGIVRPVDMTEHERGPALLFEHDPAEVRLDRWLTDPRRRTTLKMDDRFDLLRQVIEAVGFAHARGVFHRALCPSAVLVNERDDGSFQARVTNWHAGARVTSGESSSTAFTGTAHVEALAGHDAALYRAPEFTQPDARPALLDVFSLGALGLFILTSEQPAATPRQLVNLLATTGHLDPAAVADSVEGSLAEVIIEATKADPASRIPSVEDLLVYLDLLEEEWSLPDVPAEPHPLDARRGDTLGDGRFEVVHRLGQGSTAVALLVRDRAQGGRHAVLKVARDPDHNSRLLDEAAALEGLVHANIVQLYDGLIELSGHAAILVSYAGPKLDPNRAEPARQSRTLAARLASGPVGVELAERFGSDLLDALKYLEGMGRAHRDIKPENLGVTPRGDHDELHLVLYDFSLSRAPIDRIDAGTPGYLDPFLKLRGRWDPAADRYAAAVTLFELTTGSRPRYGDGTADPAMVDAPPTITPDLFDPAVSAGLTRFFTTALARHAEDRFGTADDMLLAWRAAFRPASRPATAHPEGSEGFAVPPGTTRGSPLAGLPLSARAVSALQEADVVTAGDLLALSRPAITTLRGVGAKTRAEITGAQTALRAHLGTPAPEPTPSSAGVDRPAGSGTLLALATALVPTARRSDQGTQLLLARRLAGLDGADPWATQPELAGDLQVTPARISQLVAKLRERWAKQPELTELRRWLAQELTTSGGVATLTQLAARLAASAPVGGDPAEHAAVPVGLVRAATLVEESLAAPRWLIRRRQSAIVVAAEPADEAGPPAPALADYAVSLAERAGRLLTERIVVARRELIDELQRVPAPPGARPLADGQLADLAVELCAGAAVNNRLELYRQHMPPETALHAARRALITLAAATPAELAAKVASRFPLAQPLPGRPELDRLLAEAGLELRWVDSAGRYEAPQYELAGTSASTTLSRYPTMAAVDVPPAEIDNAAEFEQRLLRSTDHGGLLVLTADPRELAKAATQLDRLVAVTVDVDSWLIDEVRALTAAGKPSWQLVVDADAAGPASPQWARLQALVDRASDRFTERLAATSGTVLLTNLGLLARYDRVDLVARWRDLLHGGQHPLRSLWLLLPATGASDVPLLDGKAVPVISRNEWTQIPDDWLRNAHRTGVPR